MVMPWIVAGAATPEIAEQLVSQEVIERPVPAVVEEIVARIEAPGEVKRQWYNEIYAPQSGVTVPTTQPEVVEQAAVSGAGVGVGIAAGGGMEYCPGGI